MLHSRQHSARRPSTVSASLTSTQIKYLRVPDTLLDSVKQEQTRAREAGRGARGGPGGPGQRGPCSVVLLVRPYRRICRWPWWYAPSRRYVAPCVLAAENSLIVAQGLLDAATRAEVRREVAVAQEAGECKARSRFLLGRYVYKTDLRARNGNASVCANRTALLGCRARDVSTYQS